MMTDYGSDGLSFFYLKDIPTKDVENLYFSYTKQYEGFGVIMDTMPDEKLEGTKENYIFGMEGSTSKYTSVW